MKFLFPGFLFALTAVAIPIIIHLFNFRRFKRVYFTNVQLLKEVDIQTQSHSRLRHLLVLACRILAITFLVLAFAQPFIPGKDKVVDPGSKAISIYIDNSFSMEALGPNGTMLDEAKKHAADIAKSYGQTDRFQLLTNDFEAKHQRLIGKDEFLQALDEVKSTASVKTISDVIRRQTDLLSTSESKSKRAFILSDLQKSVSALDLTTNDTAINFTVLPLKANERNNVFIDSCWFESPVIQKDHEAKLHVRIRNIGDKAIENNALKLFINGVERSPASFSVNAGDKTEIVITYLVRENGYQQGLIQLNDHPVSFDDAFYFSYNSINNIHVLNIVSDKQDKGPSADAIQTLLGKDSLFVLTTQYDTKMDYSALANQTLVILNELPQLSSGLVQELKKFTERGGTLLFIPSEKGDINSYNDFFGKLKTDGFTSIDTVNTKVERINYEDDVFKDVFEGKDQASKNVIDLPKVFTHFVLTHNTRTSAQTLLGLLNGHAFLNRYATGKGHMYILASPLTENAGNFSKHALFVPVVYKIAGMSAMQTELFQTVGTDESIAILFSEESIKETVFHLISAASNPNKTDLIPEQRAGDDGLQLLIHDQIKLAGNYLVIKASNTVKGVSFNYDRRESDLSCYSNQDIQTLIKEKGYTNISVPDTVLQDASTTLAQLDKGTQLWKICVIFALLFLMLEIVLLRYLKA